MKNKREQINRYLHQQMNSEERQAFEQSLASDSVLRQELNEEMEKMEVDFVDWLSDEMLRKDIEEISAEIEAEEEPAVAPKLKVVERSAPRRLRPNWLRYAAAVAVLLVSTTFLYRYLAAPQINGLALSEQYYGEYKPDFTSATKGSVNTQADDFSKIKGLLDTNDPKDLNTALNYFNSIQKEDANYAEALYLMAHIAFLQNNHGAAVITFERFITAFPDHRERPFADFYRVLALMSNEQNVQALEGLDQIIATSDHPYQGLAKKLKTQLSSTLPSNR